MNKFGVILARFQPVHEGHLALIKKACSENQTVILLVGSADKNNERNPIPINLRFEMLEEALTEKGLRNKCMLISLDDLTSESDNSIEWGFYLYSKIVDITKESSFTMYYSDGYEIITTWFPGFILRNYVSLVLLARGKVEKGISATEVRNLLQDYAYNDKYLEKLKECVPSSVFNRRDILKSLINIYKKK